MYLKKIVCRDFLSIFLPVFFILVLSNEHTKTEEYNLTFAVSGVVSSVEANIGDKVKVGTILAVLDHAPFDAERRAAVATYNLANLVLTLSEDRLEQSQELFDALSISGEELEKSKIEYAKSLSGYKVAKSQVEIATWRLQQATLKSPFVGIVTAIPGYPGIVVNNNGFEKPIIVIKKE